MSSYTQPDKPTSQPPEPDTYQPSSTVADLELPDFAIALPLPANIAISLAMFPLLTVIVSGQIAARSLIQWGSGSEELFRGSRLPAVPLLTAAAQIE